MKDVLSNEIKKFFKPFLTKMIMIIVLVFPFLMLSSQLFVEKGERALMNDVLISGIEVRKQKEIFQSSISGEINEEWLCSVERRFDPSSNDLYDQTLKEAYDKSLHMFVMRETMLNDETIDDDMRSIYLENPIFYGPQETWKLFFEMLSVSLIVYGIACIFLFAGLFNKEEETGAIELLKSSKYGRLQLCISKILVAFMITGILGLLVNGICQMLSILFLKLPRQNVSVIQYPFIQMFSYQQISHQTIYFTLLGGFVCTTFSLLTSTITKKISTSLSTGIVFFAFPMLMKLTMGDFLIYIFFPSLFLNISNQSLRFPWIELFNQMDYCLIALLKVWLPLIMMMIGFVICHQCKDILYNRKLRDF